MTQTKSLNLNEKTTILAFRGVVFLFLCFFLLYAPAKGDTFSWEPAALVLLYLVSNLALFPVERARFADSLIPIAIFLFDTGLISWIIYMGEGFNSDIYLIYFLIIFMAGLQVKIWQSFLIGTVASLIYVFLWTAARPGEDLLNTHTLLRLPFFYLISFFSAYFARQVQEKEERVAAQHKAELAKARYRSMTGQIAGKIAFAMNNPLAIIIGFGQSFVKQTGSDSHQQLAARHMLDGANRCREMIDNLLLLSDQSWAPLDSTDLNAVVRDTVSALREERAFGDKKIELRQELQDDLPPVQAEKRQLGRALKELIKNSLDAMPNGGVLVLRTRLANETKRGEVICEVEDTGQGIDPALLPLIFEPFFTTKEGDGKGLGLSYVSAIMQRHCGSVSFTTEPGRGTNFALKFPLGSVYDGRTASSPRIMQEQGELEKI
ncbi:MAG: hypothetical protein A2X28_01350 [Elusimicrobia bacterium GWA2_56_46]|nr:MAG: hypothetical protein A2X28_01350 [Elusimicrobia bacterium GWA2_56_46]OGR53803.1 MAG: hypothetical protein A2X39_06750 [Elusimicrobia bacterium GWC2_56_31]HBB68038.1 hypothetical protein [Elusimicrobiota bacterium]HBW22655.1 hypothetical protein [Elusimicrobiota bacterium]